MLVLTSSASVWWTTAFRELYPQSISIIVVSISSLDCIFSVSVKNERFITKKNFRVTSTFKKHVLFKEKIAWVLMENYFRIQKQFLDEFLFLNNQEKPWKLQSRKFLRSEAIYRRSLWNKNAGQIKFMDFCVCCLALFPLPNFTRNKLT